MSLPDDPKAAPADPDPGKLNALRQRMQASRAPKTPALAPKARPARRNAPTREGLVMIAGHFSPQLRDELKIIAIRHKRSLNDELEAAFKAHLASHGVKL